MPHTVSTSMFHANPFNLLKVSLRDGRQTILQQAEMMGLELDPETCQQARADLTHPRRRLAPEIAWLPGISPRAASQALARLRDDPLSFAYADGLPALARFNLLTAAFGAFGPADSAPEVGQYLCKTAQAFDAVQAEQVMQDINADRVAAGFSEWTDMPALQTALHEHLRHARSAIEAALDRLPPATLLDVITIAVDTATGNGEHMAGELIDELVDSFALRITPLLEQEGKAVRTLAAAVRAAAPGGEAAVRPALEKLDKVTRNWDRFAQPIQLSAKARGLEHSPSAELARELRELGVFLFNEHGLLDSSQYITAMLADVFAELPEVVEIVDQDVATLAEFELERKAAAAEDAAEQEEWERAVTFQAEVGMMFKDTLGISPAGVAWKGSVYPLDSITAVRWGALKRSVNGIPTGTYYTVALVVGGATVVIDLRREHTYDGFVGALWRAVGLRLMTGMLRQFKAGDTLEFGGMRVRDDGVIINKPRFLRSDVPTLCRWDDVKVWNGNGSFVVASEIDKKQIRASASYMEHWNTHVLEQVIRAGLKHGKDRLSSLI